MGRSLLHASLVMIMAGVATSALAAAQSGVLTPPAAQAALTLDSVLTMALAQNPLVEAARAELNAAEGSRQTAGTAPNPVATLWIDNARFPGQGPLTRVDRETSAYATLPLEPFLQRSSRVARADADVRGAQSGVISAEQRVGLQAAEAFYRVALAQSAVDAATENRDGLQQLVDYLRTRVAEGASPEGDAIRAQLERDRADVAVTLADVELLRAQSALRPWLGSDPLPLGSIRVVVPMAPLATVTLAPFNDLSAHAVATRPDILASRARRDAATRAVSVQRSMMLGQIGASFGLKRSADTTAMAAGLSMTVPIFDRNRGEIQRATGEQLAAEDNTRWLERTVVSDLEGAYEAASRLTLQVAALRPTFIQRAEESRQIALGAFREGAATLLQVLDASRALTDVRLAYMQALVAAHQSVFELGVMAGYDPKTAAHMNSASAGPVDAMGTGGVR